ncbi:hypothetical protein SHY80_11250, partial [Streptococcus suis]|uniref:hypothetical protein n=1 Tax=Streptococcus suis TaxID=1307 RepID=UPI0029C12319
PGVFSFVTALMLAVGCWFLILGADRFWFFGVLFIVIGYIGQFNYPIFKYLLSENASDFCGVYGVSASRYRSVENIGIGSV